MQALATGAMLAGVAYVSRWVLVDKGAATILFVCFVGPALLLTPVWSALGQRIGKKQGYVASSLVLAVAAAAAPVVAVRPDLVGVRRDRRSSGVGYAGAQVFPMAMLPDAAAVDARRTGENRAGVYTGVWTAGETLGLALGPGRLRAGARRSAATVSADADDWTSAFQPDSALTAIVLGFSLLPAVLIVAQPVLPVAATGSTHDDGRARRRSSACMNDVLARLREMQADDVPVTGGRTLAYVYDSGLEEADRVGREAVAAYAGSNGLDPTAFPSLLTMENELVGFAADLLDAPDDDRRHRHLRRHRVGAARRAGCPRLAARHRAPADGAAGDGARRVPQGGALLRRRGGDGRRRRGLPGPSRPRWRRRSTTGPCSWWPAPRRTPTAWSTRSPRSPRPRQRAGCAATSTPASAAGCCRTPPGSAATVPPWTFAVDGVTSISVDLHKYAYAPKGTSILLHRTPELRRPQFFASAAGPATRCSTRRCSRPSRAARWPARGPW